MWVDKKIKENGKNIIKPFSEDKIGCISYDIAYDGYIDKNNNLIKGSVLINPGESIIVKAIESIEVPNNVVITVGEKNSRIRQGLSISAPKYFPSHKTNIYLRISNISPMQIEIKEGETIAQLFIEDLNEEPETLYANNTSASFNDEINYLGYGKYEDAYNKQMRKIKIEVDKLENLENNLYANILTLMGIFVSIFSLIVVNVSNFASLEIKALLKINISMAFIIAILLGVILFFMNKKRFSDKGQRNYVIFIGVLCVALIAALIVK